MRPFFGKELALELLDPGSVGLVRLFRRPGAHWEPPPPEFRVQRCDPPPEHKGDYALLYMCDSVQASAAECRILNVDRRDRYSFDEALTESYQVVRYNYTGPALFIPMDADNRETMGLDVFQIGYAHYQKAAHELWRRYRGVAHGLSWSSFHRNQPGRVYALWHEHKDSIGLAVDGPEPHTFHKLVEDPDWQAFLDRSPEVTEIQLQPGE